MSENAQETLQLINAVKYALDHQGDYLICRCTDGNETIHELHSIHEPFNLVETIKTLLYYQSTWDHDWVGLYLGIGTSQAHIATSPNLPNVNHITFTSPTVNFMRTSYPKYLSMGFISPYAQNGVFNYPQFLQHPFTFSSEEQSWLPVIQAFSSAIGINLASPPDITPQNLHNTTDRTISSINSILRKNNHPLSRTLYNIARDTARIDCYKHWHFLHTRERNFPDSPFISEELIQHLQDLLNTKD